MKELMQKTLKYLENIEVKGRRNLDYLLAAIQNVSLLLDALNNPTDEEDAHDGDDKQGQDV